MNRVLCAGLLFLSIGVASFAILVSSFADTDSFLDRAKEIVVAQCVGVPEQGGVADGLQAVDVSVLKVLKGGGRTGPRRIATIHAMKPQTTYMLYCDGGSARGTDFLAIPELSVVPLPATFKVGELDDKDLKEQVQYAFSRRLFEVERELAPLLKEKGLLEKAVSDRRSQWFESTGTVAIGKTEDVRTETDGKHTMWLDLGGKKLLWSHSSPGESGFFYFEKIGGAWEPYWEFAACDAATIEELAGKPLKARFYGLYTPGRSESALGWTGAQAIYVKVGQVLLARTVDDPRAALAIQIMGQDKEREAMSARFIVIRQ